MEIPIESKRLKAIREELGLTQTGFAEQLDIGHTTADIERGRTKISGTIVMQLLRDYHINPLWLFGQSQQKHLNPNNQDVSPKTISVDNIGHENILLVNEKAAAGYAGNIGDPDYYLDIPAFTFPLPEYRNATFRGFQIEGNSMLPAIKPGEWIITKAITEIKEIKDGKIYVVVEDEGLRVKKIINNTTDHTLSLISINSDYPLDTINYGDVKELWEFHSMLTKNLSDHSQSTKLNAIHEDIKRISTAIGSMK